MLRKLVILGVFAGLSASVPILYDSNPEAVEALLRSPFGEKATEPELSTPLKIARAESGVDQLPGKKVLIRPDQGGHFRAEFKLNGRRVDGMIDTGATLVAINKSTARKIGISLQPDDFKYEVRTANGTVRAAATKVETIQLGRIAVEGVEVLVLEDDALDQTLVGLNFLNRLSKYQVQNGELILMQ